MIAFPILVFFVLQERIKILQGLKHALAVVQGLQALWALGKNPSASALPDILVVRSNVESVCRAHGCQVVGLALLLDVLLQILILN
jgi:hypothetical protein